MINDHSHYMQMALLEAEKAGQIDEVPIGAILASEKGEILAATHNRPIRENDPTAHAEILALREAASKLNNYRLLNTTLYVTIEPCMMCMGAIIHARVARVVYGAADLKWGAADSLYNLAQDLRLNHQVEIISGVFEAEGRELIQNFFRKKRQAITTEAKRSQR